MCSMQDSIDELTHEGDEGADEDDADIAYRLEVRGY